MGEEVASVEGGGEGGGLWVRLHDCMWQNVRLEKHVACIYVRGTCVRDTRRDRLFSDPYRLQLEKWIPHFNAG
jgi:hypothetical protein